MDAAFCGECGAALASDVEVRLDVGDRLSAEMPDACVADEVVDETEAMAIDDAQDVPFDAAQDEPFDSAQDESMLPLRVYLDGNRVLQQDALGVLALRFDNAGDEALSGIELTIEFPAEAGMAGVQERCELVVGRRRSRRLKAGARGELALNVHPKVPGEVLACFRIEAVTASGDRLRLTSLRPKLLEVNVAGVQSIQNVITVTGENAADFSGWKVDAASHTVKMVGRTHEAEWEELELAQEAEARVTGARTVRVLGDPKRIVPIERAMLIAGEGRRSRRILIFAKDTLRLGKMKPRADDAEANDVVLRVVPQTGRNRELSASINRKNLLVDVSARGVRAKKLSAANPTTLNADEMETGRWYALDDGDVISPAKVLDLQFGIFRGGGLALDGATKNGAPVDGATVEASGRGDEEIAAVRVQRTRNLAGVEEYLVLRRCATIGCAHTCAVLLDRLDVAMEQARLHAHEGYVFIEALCEEPPIRVEGVRLRVGQLVPLARGMTIAFGDEGFRFIDAEQVL